MADYNDDAYNCENHDDMLDSKKTKTPASIALRHASG